MTDFDFVALMNELHAARQVRIAADTAEKNKQNALGRDLFSQVKSLSVGRADDLDGNIQGSVVTLLRGKHEMKITILSDDKFRLDTNLADNVYDTGSVSPISKRDMMLRIMGFIGLPTE